MNRSMWTAVAVVVVGIAGSGMAMPVIEFSPDPSTAGSWVYNSGLKTLSFNQDIAVDRGASNDSDSLVGTLVQIPTLKVGGSGGTYSLTPIGSNQIKIMNASGTKTYMTGSLGLGDMVTFGTVAGGYTQFKTDITNVVITPAGQALGSAALDIIGSMSHPSLDFELSLNGGSNTNYHSFAAMIDGGYSGNSTFSGAMSVPEPTTVALLGLGGLGLLRRRRRH